MLAHAKKIQRVTVTVIHYRGETMDKVCKLFRGVLHEELQYLLAHATRMSYLSLFCFTDLRRTTARAIAGAIDGATDGATLTHRVLERGVTRWQLPKPKHNRSSENIISPMLARQHCPGSRSTVSTNSTVVPAVLFVSFPGSIDRPVDHYVLCCWKSRHSIS